MKIVRLTFTMNLTQTRTQYRAYTQDEIAALTGKAKAAYDKKLPQVNISTYIHKVICWHIYILILYVILI